MIDEYDIIKLAALPMNIGRAAVLFDKTIDKRDNNEKFAMIRFSGSKAIAEPSADDRPL